jgi:hypothetical protein
MPRLKSVHGNSIGFAVRNQLLAYVFIYFPMKQIITMALNRFFPTGIF